MAPRIAAAFTLVGLLCAWGCGAGAVKHPVEVATPQHTGEITIQVSPRWVMAQFGNFHAIVRIQLNPDNRWLQFGYEGEKASYSTLQLDELNADQQTFEFPMKNVPSGNYIVQATLVRKVKGQLVYFSDQAEIAVCGPGMDSCGGTNAKF